MTVATLTESLGVTATAIRQRLDRLVETGMVERRKVAAEGRGRPTFAYALTVQGHRQAGADLSALAEAMWQEIFAMPNGRARRSLLRRIARRLGQQYRLLVASEGPVNEQMETLARVLAARRIPAGVTSDDGVMPILEVHTCPYPELATGSAHREMCHLEERMFSEALGRPVQLSSCRLDGDGCCRFHLAADGVAAIDPETESESEPESLSTSLEGNRQNP
jgi:predicted ArsR family transcriptional regulator